MFSMSRPAYNETQQQQVQEQYSRPARDGSAENSQPREQKESTGPLANKVLGKPQKCLFVGNIPFETTEEEVLEVFSPFGEIEHTRPGVSPDGTARGFCHVQFKDLESAKKAMDAHLENPLWLRTRRLRLDFAQSNVRGTARRSDKPNSKLYFFGMKGDENELREIFRNYQRDIFSIYFLRDGQGRIRGNGWIDFDSVEAASKALTELNGHITSAGLPIGLTYAVRERVGYKDRQRPYGLREKEGGDRERRPRRQQREQPKQDDIDA
ncbi:hypothetical protein FB107DRAFT_264954 [Schizophyllum commune]